MKNHEYYMQRCFQLAMKGYGLTSPNPLVGAIFVKNDTIIAEGFHHQAGKAHAEIDAISNAQASLTDSTLYCNLEPCCHLDKKTAPCTKALIGLGLRRVVIANLDPNPKVSGKGVQQLRDAGIEVILNVLHEEGRKLNHIFFTHITQSRPYIHLKWAQTIDGDMATINGDSKWISNKYSRKLVHQWRKEHDAILVGKGTVNDDNPHLTTRIDNTESCKTRIIFDPNLNCQLNSIVFQDRFKDKTIVLTHKNHQEINCFHLTTDNGKIDLPTTLKYLYKENKITSILIEGGAKVLSLFLENDLYDRISIFTAPLLLGPGKRATDYLTKKSSITQSIHLPSAEITQLEDNILFDYRRETNVHRPS